MKVSELGLALIKKFEGFPYDGRPYWDSDGRVWTRGYGRTRGIHRTSARITEAQATRELESMLHAEYLPAIARLPTAGSLNSNQIDALASFVWNTGPGAIGSSTGIGRALRARDYRRAADELLKWDKAGGRTLLGLTRRRRAERALFLRAVHRPSPADWLTATELRRVRELDAIRGGRIKPAHPRREAVLVRVLVEQRKRIWRAAQVPDGWNRRYRRLRYASLLARTR